MAFFPISKLSTFGAELTEASKLAQRLVDNIDLQVARVGNMDDSQVATLYGTTLTQAQLLSTLTTLQTRLNHSSVTDLTTKIG
jgi:hypothetical protein